MKLLDVFRMINESQFLVERDVINAKELKAWAKESAARLTDPQAATWYASQLSKYLINRYEAGLKTAQFDAQAPDWVMAKLDAGEQIYTVEPQQELRQQAEQVIDWLNSAHANENSSPNLRMSWEDAVEAQAEWHKDIARQSRVTELTADQMLGVVTIMEFDDGFRWVDVQTEVCLQHEGTVMGHCVGQGAYTQGVSDATTKILSLRDANNNPHATIEGSSEHPIHITAEMLNSTQADLFIDNALEQSFLDMVISQIKGKENKAVVRKYREYVQDFLTKFQIDTYKYGGINDLENCGLFKLHKGGYTNIEEAGEQIVSMEDGTTWHRVDDEYVVLSDGYDGHAAKWFLFDKTGRSVGQMEEETRGQISRINMDDVHWGGYGSNPKEKEKYKDHVVAAFNSKYDKNRSTIVPTIHLYHGFYNTLEGMALGVNSTLVNEPQTIGKLRLKTSAGDVYATQASGLDGDMFWLMSGDKIKSRFSMQNAGEGMGYKLIFDNNRGLPSGSITNFIKEFEGIYPGEVNINYAQIQDQMLEVANIEWEPKQSSELVMEEDGVRFYTHVNDQQNASSNDWKREADDHTWYMAIDEHNQLIFSMILDSGPKNSGIRAHNSQFKVRLGNKKIAGYYAVYLIEHLGEDIGDYKDYSSFARELLDETGWFEGGRGQWYVQDETFKIHFTETHTYDDDTEENVYDDDTTMQHYWDETGLRDSGMEEDYFAGEYEVVYTGRNTGYDDEHDGYDQDHDGPEHVRTDYYIQGIGDEATVTHPVSGGSMRIQK